MQDKNISEAVYKFNNNVTEIRFGLMKLFIGLMRNYQITGFDFSDTYDREALPDEGFKIMRVGISFMQVSVLEEMNYPVQQLINSYIPDECHATELWIDDKGVYIEILFGDFS